MASVLSQDGNENLKEKQSSRRRYQAVNLILEPTPGFGGLHLGDVSATEDQAYLQKHNISCILTVADCELASLSQNLIEYHKIVRADDTPTFRLMEFFTDCFQFIHEHRSNGRSVLVHCMGGVSRSATIVIGYLMTVIPTMNFYAALSHVRKIRKTVRPNDGFLDQLREYGQLIEEKRHRQEILI